MHLTDELTQQRQQFLANAPKDIIELMGTATEQLRDTGIEKNCLQVGEKAPAITLKDTDNQTIELYKALETGPVVVKFFRGHW